MARKKNEIEDKNTKFNQKVYQLKKLLSDSIELALGVSTINLEREIKHKLESLELENSCSFDCLAKITYLKQIV